MSYISNGETWDDKRSVARVFAGKTNFWQNILKRLVNVTLMLVKCNLPFRGSSEELSKESMGNFISITQLFTKYDTVLDKLLQPPEGSPKYLSPLIQNEPISVQAKKVLRDIKSELQIAPFFAIILDTTHDVSKKDQLSEVFCYVKINYHDDGTPSELKVEAFTSFIEVEDSSAIGLHKLTTNCIQRKGLDIKNCRGQGYDGFTVMSGKYSGLHKKIQDVAPHPYYVHCASQNLYLMLKDATEAVTETRQFATSLSRYIIFSDIVLHGGKSFKMSMIVLAQIQR